MEHELAPEVCDECGFDEADWTLPEAIRVLDATGWFVGHALEKLDPTIAMRRPEPDIWSIREYLGHITALLITHLSAVEQAVTEPGSVFSPGHPGHVPGDDLHDVVAGLESAGEKLARVLRDVADDDWDLWVVSNDRRWTISWVAIHSVHELFHHLWDVTRVRHSLGDAVTLADGVIEQISVSDGGVPKRATSQGTIDRGGLAGDRQADRRHHGMPFQAVCLYSADVIDTLRAEGHPIDYGSAGENLTLRGIDWARLRSGATVMIGDVRLRLTTPAVPCGKNNRWFTGNDSTRMSHDLHPGSSRWYAAVVDGGALAKGDRVAVFSEGISLDG